MSTECRWKKGTSYRSHTLPSTFDFIATETVNRAASAPSQFSQAFFNNGEENQHQQTAVGFLGI